MASNKLESKNSGNEADDLTIEERSSSSGRLSYSAIRPLVVLLAIVVASLLFLGLPHSSFSTFHSTSLRTRPSTALNVPSLDELKSYLHFTYAAFCPDETLQNWTCSWCNDEEFQMTAILFNETTKTRGYVGFIPSKGTIIASFRGSAANANWVLDLEPGRTKAFHGVTVRKGWYLGYQALREQLWNAIQEIHSTSCPSCSTFITTGHSLGAAISGLAALDVKLLAPWIQSAGMRNFGMPRVGDQAFVRLFQQNIESSFRVVHYRDLVPHYPLRTGFHPYHHVGSELWEAQETFNGTLVHCDGTGEDTRCSSSIPVWHWNPDDHMTYLGIHNDNCGQ